MRDVIAQKSKRPGFSIECCIDGWYFPSLFSLAIDFELDYKWLRLKLARNGGAPVTISGHTIALASWLEQHPEYEMKKENEK